MRDQGPEIEMTLQIALGWTICATLAFLRGIILDDRESLGYLTISLVLAILALILIWCP